MKVYYYLTIIIGLMVLFNAAGYTMPSGGIVNTLVLSDDNSGTGRLQNIQNSNFLSLFLTAVAAVTGVGIVAGLFVSLPPINYLIGAFLSSIIGLFLIDVLWLYGKMVETGATWQVFLATSIFAPLIIGFIISAVEWWQGVD